MNLDTLEIKIQSNADTAAQSLIKLETALSGVSKTLGSINGSSINGFAGALSNLSTASKGFFSGVTSKQFSSVVTNLNKLATLNMGGLVQSSASLSSLSANMTQLVTTLQGLPKIETSLVRFTSSLATLSNANAPANIQQLGTAFGTLITQLNQLPAVNPNLQSFVNSLAQLTRGTVRISGSMSGGSGGGSITDLFSKFGRIKAVVSTTLSTIKKFIPSINSVAAAVGTLYANFYLVKRVVDGIWKFIEKAMNYGETLNYFNNAFADIGRKSGESWGNAFMSTGQSYIEKMTGYKTNENGNLQSTGATSLGMNPTDIMNYAATFGQMSSSMGVASDNAFTLSEVLVKIGADLASMKNEDFDTMWEKMSSGLQGNAKAWRSLGVDISVASMNEKLAELGFSATADNLTQADKALLRTIMLLDSSEYAWSDLAETMNSPANQVRRLKENFEMLGQTIGSIFMPIVAKVLPYVNALVMALQRLAQFVATLMGFENFDWGFGGGNSLPEEMEDLENATGGAAKNAKELKKQLLGIDEINNLSTNDKNGSGKGGVGGIDLSDAFNEATSKYLKDWEEKFKNIEDISQGIADNIEKWLEPLKKMFADFSIGDFEGAGGRLSEFIKNTLSKADEWLTAIDWKKVGEKIGEFLRGVDWLGIGKEIFNLLIDGMGSVKDLASGIWETLYIDNDALPEWVRIIFGFLPMRTDWSDKIVEGIVNISLSITDFGLTVFKKFEEIKNKAAEILAGIYTKVKSYATVIAQTVKKEWRSTINSIIGLLEQFANTWVDTFVGVSGLGTFIQVVSGKTIAPAHIKLPRISEYATGGYPAGSSLFWAGERGAEMLGTVGGKTAVASNGEITGISETIRDTSYAEIELLREQNELLTAILQKPGISRRDIYDSAITEDRIRRKATGRSGFAY